jgi:predicted transcriptional regulator of viral defense system
MQATDSSVSTVHLTRELTAQGLQAAELRRMARSGSLDHVRRGAYADVVGDPSAELRHRQLIAATTRLVTPEACLSHLSAAVLHGLPVPANRLDRVHVTRSRWSGNGRRDRWVHVHGAPLDAESITTVEGLRVTSLDRTAVDTARLLPFGQALAVSDAALRAGADHRNLVTVMDGLGRRRGMPVARAAVAYADGRSESAGESLSRAVFLTHHIPPPELQYEVRDRSGRLVARADFCWEAFRTIGEFDGRVKYGRAFDPGTSVETVVYAEKLREDALRDLGWQVVRWSWADLATPQVVVDRLVRAFRRAGAN